MRLCYDPRCSYRTWPTICINIVKSFVSFRIHKWLCSLKWLLGFGWLSLCTILEFMTFKNYENKIKADINVRFWRNEFSVSSWNDFEWTFLSWIQAQQTHPTFVTTYENTLQKIDIDFSALELLLHQECILNLMEFGQSIQDRMPKPKDSGHSLGRAISTASLISVSSSVRRSGPRRSKTFLPIFSWPTVIYYVDRGLVSYRCVFPSCIAKVCKISRNYRYSSKKSLKWN